MCWFSGFFGSDSKKTSDYSVVARPVKGIGGVFGVQHTGLLHRPTGVVLDLQKSRSGRTKIRTVSHSQFAEGHSVQQVPLSYDATHDTAVAARWNDVVNAEKDRSIRKIPYCPMNEDGLNCHGLTTYVAHGVSYSPQADAVREAGLADIGRLFSSSSQSSHSFSSFEDD